MDKKTFIDDHKVVHTIDDLKHDLIHKKVFSDLIDGNGNQYVELVLEGGGVWGSSLVGFVHVMEEMGIRFFSVAGTSAGAIVATLLAGMGRSDRRKSEKLVELFAVKNFNDFLDGNSRVKKFIYKQATKKNFIILLWKYPDIANAVFSKLGFIPGHHMSVWLTDILGKMGAGTTRELEANFRELPPDLILREGTNGTLEGLEPFYGVIAGEITTGCKAIFPKMADLYWKDPGEVNPALYVRASTSVPYVFEPMIVEDLPLGPEACRRWREKAKYAGEIPDNVMFVDGGIVSNFPIDIFHKKTGVPRMPTVGVRLGMHNEKISRITNPVNMYSALLNIARNHHDSDFLLNNREYEITISEIDVDGFYWLDFNIGDNDKLELFRRGVKAGSDFVRRMDWERYKEEREKNNR